LYLSLLAELLGVALFQLLAGSAGDDPLTSAFALAGIMYATKYISGAWWALVWWGCHERMSGEIHG
jgi:hypothetical protein